jgi:rare lipoprotein A
LVRLRGEKDTGADNSAFLHKFYGECAAGAGRRSVGVESALAAGKDRSGVRNVRGVVALACLCLAGCAQPPAPVAHRSHGREYFAEGKYGRASPRMIDDGQPVPRGGGQYLVGHPYSVAGRTYYPQEDEHYVGVGYASWYGDAFHGRKTANGEIYDKTALSAAHPTMPLPSYARVTNLGNGYSIIVRVNDRGPYAAGRVMDVSSRVADVLDFKRTGTARVKVEYVGKAPLEGSDDDELLATLKTDGGPANMDGGGTSLVAEAASPLIALFGGRSAPPPAPPPPEPPPRAAPVEAAAPLPPARPAPPEADAPEVADSEETTVAPRAAAAPLPPVRPYDLGRVREASAAPKPPVRPPQGSRALYFDNPPPAHEDPLGRLLRRKPARSMLDDDDN